MTPLLQTGELTRRFGKLVAVDRVTLAVRTRGYVYVIDSQTGKVTRK